MDIISLKTLDLHIVDTHGDIFNSPVHKVSVQSVMGEMGILPNHAPLVAKIKPGEVRIINLDKEEDCIYVSGGILEVQPTEVTILADTAIRGEEIDEAAALEAKQRAEEKMQDKNLLYSDRDKIQLELQKALAQLTVLRDARKKRKFR
jgi:F-type H+-transporting ATPase subunit epsilon